METDLIDFIVNIPELASVDRRVHWLTRPQGQPELPAIVMTKVSSVGQITSLGQNDLYESSLQVDCWADSFNDALSVSNSFKSEMIGQRFQHGLTEFQGVFFDSESHTFEDFGSQSPKRYYRVRLDIRVWHKAIPSS